MNNNNECEKIISTRNFLKIDNLKKIDITILGDLTQDFKDFGELRNLVFRDYHIYLLFRDKSISIFTKRVENTKHIDKIVTGSKLLEISIKSVENLIRTNIKFELESMNLSLEFTDYRTEIDIFNLRN